MKLKTVSDCFPLVNESICQLFKIVTILSLFMMAPIWTARGCVAGVAKSPSVTHTP